MVAEVHLNELKHYDEDTLVHFGVKGMKWGVRKGPDSGRPPSDYKPSRSEKKAARVQTKADNRAALNKKFGAKEGVNLSRVDKAMITKLDDLAVSRDRDRKTYEYGASGSKALLYGGPLGLAVVKSKRMNDAMQKRWDVAAKMDGDMKARIQAGKKTAEDKFAALLSVSVLDIAGANKKVNTTGAFGKKNLAPRD